MRISVTVEKQEGDKAVDPTKAAEAVLKALGGKKSDSCFVSVVGMAGTLVATVEPEPAA